MNKNKLLPDEINAKEILEKDFIPVLETELKKGKNYLAVVQRYSFNYCRQSTILSSKILEVILPNYEWEVWEAMWECNFLEVKGTDNYSAFDHAWLYGYDKASGRALSIDLTLNSLVSYYSGDDFHFQGFRLVEGNYFPEDMREFQNVIVRKKQKMDIEDALQVRELYTELKGEKLLKKVCKNMKHSNELREIIYN